MPADPRIRASDEDRDRVASMLREHHAVGRLTVEEFNERLDKAYAATDDGRARRAAGRPAADRPVPAAGRVPAALPGPGGRRRRARLAPLAMVRWRCNRLEWLRRAPMPADPRIRASDEDRDRVASMLREHHAVGRLTVDEFNERLDKAYAARTMGDLDELLADLPGIDLDQLPDASRPGYRGPAAGGGGAPLGPRPRPSDRRPGQVLAALARGLGIVAQRHPGPHRDLGSQRRRLSVVPVGGRAVGGADAGRLDLGRIRPEARQRGTGPEPGSARRGVPGAVTPVRVAGRSRVHSVAAPMGCRSRMAFSLRCEGSYSGWAARIRRMCASTAGHGEAIRRQHHPAPHDAARRGQE